MTQSTADVDRARRLFSFFARVQELRAGAKVLDVAKYAEQGAVVWFADLPDHPAVSDLRQADSETDDLLRVERVPVVEPPHPDDQLVPWITGGWGTSKSEPGLAPSIEEPTGDRIVPTRTRHLEDHPEISDAFRRWSAQWRQWADKDRYDEPARRLYRTAWDAHRRATGEAEEMELRAGMGLLTARNGDGSTMRRHVLMAPVESSMHERSGTITFSVAAERLLLELDMLDNDTPRDVQKIADVREEVRQFVGNAVDLGQSRPFLERLANALDSSVVLDDDDQPPRAIGNMRITSAPALILRRRSARGIVEMLDGIAEAIEAAGEVPDGVYPLIDPDRQPTNDLDWSDAEGAMVTIDDEVFLPKPVNERQLEVIRRVTRQPQTVVQGPPGTGKTHTAAALISHLLAMGKRVLVTAQTDRALEELRDKLPESIRPLSVSVIGTGRKDFDQLSEAAQRIRQTAADFDLSESQRKEAQWLQRLDELRAARAAVSRDLVAARADEVETSNVNGYGGSRGRIAEHVGALEDRFSWIADAAVAPDLPPPISAEHALAYLRFVTEPAVWDAASEARLGLLPLSDLPKTESFRELVESEAAAHQAVARHGSTDPAARNAALNLTHEDRERVQSSLGDLTNRIAHAGLTSRPWARQALADVCAGTAGPWESRFLAISELVAAIGSQLASLGSSDSIVCNNDPGPLKIMAESVLASLDGDPALKVNADGSPRLTVFSPKVVKQSEALFGSVRVNGAPPTTAESLQLFVQWAEAHRLLDQLDRAWPPSVTIGEDDTLAERLDLHKAELQVLDALLSLQSSIESCERKLQAVGLPIPAWGDPASIGELQACIAHADAMATMREATQAVANGLARIRPYADVPQPPGWAVHLIAAIEARDVGAFVEVRRRIEELHRASQAAGWCAEIEALLHPSMPWLRSRIEAETDAPWEARLREFEDAWRWAGARQWLSSGDRADSNELGKRLDNIDEQIRDLSGELAAERTWRQAVAPERMTGRMSASLAAYVTLVRKLGKGTGKNAARKQRDVRAALEECRPAVPVWIMPLYRVADQLTVEADQFDVVVVDEASQANGDAVFLQYLAPKIVVIGDDKQVSPTVIVNQGVVRSLASQHLDGIRLKSLLAVADISLFDLANAVYGGLITLVEHRRCVPEIIGFSNLIAYEPEGIRLVPVRQFGQQRLRPIETVFVPEGYREGSSGHSVNRAEAAALVECLEKCHADPRYDGLTFGVISLQGPTQAKLIEAQLLERLGPEAWAGRDLRCGDSASFQGAERDVMFLSMVAAPGETRVGSMTTATYYQRFNVAVSRAKDQFWLFHSMTLADLPNPEDVRNRLLQYCQGQRSRTDQGIVSALVSEFERERPFDSLFEQRVYNRLVERGYVVEPQVAVGGYSIDLVVQGSRSRVGVECDGDHWHGPDRYLADLSRQRDLERADWHIHRIRESEFYLDKYGTIESLCERLAHLGVHPAGLDPVAHTGPAGRSAPSQQPASEPAAEDQSQPEEEAAALDWTLDDEAPVAATAPDVEQSRPLDPVGWIDQRSVPASVAALSVEPVDVEGDETEGSSDHHDADDAALVRSGELSSGPGAGAHERGFRPYVEWESRLVANPMTAASRHLAEAMAEFVDAEGPVLVQRMFRELNKAAGNRRLGGNLRDRFSSALELAVAEDWIVLDDPLEDGDELTMTAHAPLQHPVNLRELGPRSLHDVPPRELAEALRVSRGTWEVGGEAHLRALLEVYGLKRLTVPTEAHLLRCLRLEA